MRNAIRWVLAILAVCGVSCGGPGFSVEQPMTVEQMTAAGLVGDSDAQSDAQPIPEGVLCLGDASCFSCLSAAACGQGFRCVSGACVR
jgi:hypothetical protein